MSRRRAKISILSELLSFPTVRSKDWTADIYATEAREGDLVSLSSALDTKWYLSWVREIDRREDGWHSYLLESIEDGELCWWSNVGLNIYSRERVSERPSWQWDDRQYAFNDRWKRVCYKQHDAYIVLPVPPQFKDDGSVTLGVRIRFGFSDFTNVEDFPNWKKVTMKVMSDFYLDCCRLYDASKVAAPV